MTHEEALAAVRKDGAALKSVPEALRTADVCMAAVKARHGTRTRSVLEWVPSAQLTPELCREAVRNCVYALRWIPAAMQTKELCLDAVRHYGFAVKFVPDAVRDEEICLEAVRQDGLALGAIPEALRTEKVCLAAVQEDRQALEDVPEEMLNPAVCLAAVRNDARALEFVPEDMMTAELCREAVRQDWQALRFVPDELASPELCLEAVRQNGWALKWVPDYVKTPVLCLEAVRRNGHAAKFVPETLQNAVQAALKDLEKDGRGPAGGRKTEKEDKMSGDKFKWQMLADAMQAVFEPADPGRRIAFAAKPDGEGRGEPMAIGLEISEGALKALPALCEALEAGRGKGLPEAVDLRGAGAVFACAAELAPEAMAVVSADEPPAVYAGGIEPDGERVWGGPSMGSDLPPEADAAFVDSAGLVLQLGPRLMDGVPQTLSLHVDRPELEELCRKAAEAEELRVLDPGAGTRPEPW